MQQFDREWRMQSCIRHATAPEIAPMIAAHYIGKPPGVVVCRLVMCSSDTLVGACVFALPPRETSKRYGAETWELARLWISDDVPSNAETWLIAKAVRHGTYRTQARRRARLLRRPVSRARRAHLPCR